ncbi:MAG: hypothetical protein K6T94_09030 [Paenibacillus sp.]|nr:hypothetical protein [Paenibacillus sp.]
MNFKSSDLTNLIVINTFLKDKKYTNKELSEDITYIYDRVHIIGVHNEQLKNPDERFEQREVPLNGNEIISGEFLIFKYIAHTEEMYIKEFNSMNEIENEIIAPGGITNPFIEYQLAIIKGKVKEYSIYFTDQTDSKEYKFVKGYHDDFDLKKPFNITNRRIEWMSER